MDPIFADISTKHSGTLGSSDISDEETEDYKGQRIWKFDLRAYLLVIAEATP